MILFGVHSHKIVDVPRKWNQFVSIPDAVNKTFGSKAISHLYVYKDEIYAGYGDYGSNNGPTDVVSFNEKGEVTTHLKGVETEALFPYREYDGSLYVPFVDPQGYYTPGGYCTNASGTWTIVRPPSMVHTLDVLAVDSGNTVFVCGARLDEKDDQVAHPLVLVSRDAGKTWSVSYFGFEAEATTRVIQLWSDGSNIFCVDYARKVRVSKDKGVTWQLSSEKIPKKVEYFAEYANLNGKLYRGNTDGTVSWSWGEDASAETSVYRGWS